MPTFSGKVCTCLLSRDLCKWHLELPLSQALPGLVCGYLGVEERLSRVLQLSPKEAWEAQGNSRALGFHSPHSQHLVMAVLA